MTDTSQPEPEAPASVIPHNREAEEATVGAVLINPKIFFDIQFLTANDFYIHRNKWIWEAYIRLNEQRTPVDLLTLSEELDRMGLLAEVGGSAYLTSLINQVPSSLNAASYARIVEGHAIRRNMISAANTIAKAAYDESTKIAEVFSKAATAVNQVVRSANSSKLITIAESIAKVDRMVEANSKLEHMPGIQTPLVDLNRLMGGGAQKTDVNVLAGRPGQGKTSLLMQIALHAAKYKIGEEVLDTGSGSVERLDVYQRNHVVIFTMEMPDEQLTLRLLSQLANIDFHMLRAGKLKDYEWAAYYKAISDLSELDIYMEFVPGCTPSYMRSRCEIMAAQGTLDLVCVDSLNLMESDIDFRGRTDLKTDECAKQLKNIAADFNISLWATHQMNRGIEHRGDKSKPKLSDMNEGGEKPVDGIFFIYHELADPEEKITGKSRIAASAIMCEKQRNGPTGEIPVVFKQDRFKFENCTTIKLN